MDQDLLYRSAVIEREDKIDIEARTVELSFSSETPVERAFGNEVLDHQPESVDLARLDGGAPLLLEHDRSQQVGVIERAWLDEDEKKGRAIVRFSESQLGQEIFQDVQQKIRSMVSVGYTVARFAREKAEEGMETLRAVSWTPLEVSLVSIPADATVGVGRAAESIPAPETQETPIMEETITESHEETVERVQEQPQPEVRIEVRPDKRATEIASLGEKFEAKDEAVRYISEGKSLDEFKNYLMERSASEPIEAKTGQDEIGMNNKELNRYSLAKAIMRHAEGKLDGIELEASQELEKRFGRQPQGFFVPADVFQRDLTATDSGDTGSTLVATEKPEMIEALKAQPIVAQLGARVLEGLSSNVTIPKAGVATAAFVGENASSTETTPTIGSISLSPKRVTAYSELSKQLLAQSNFDVENMIRNDLVEAINLKWDAVAIDGGGSDEPSGILDNSDLNAVTMSGAAPTWAEVVEAEQKVMEDNALGGRLAYVTTPAFMASLKTTEKSSGTGQYIWQSNTINGYPAVASNQVTASNLIFGNFENVVLASFGAVDVVSDPYSLALTGMIRVHIGRYVDVGVRHGQGFCKIA